MHVTGAPQAGADIGTLTDSRFANQKRHPAAQEQTPGEFWQTDSDLISRPLPGNCPSAMSIVVNAVGPEYLTGNVVCRSSRVLGKSPLIGVTFPLVSGTPGRYRSW
jgi:hypothetical protein